MLGSAANSECQIAPEGVGGGGGQTVCRFFPTRPAPPLGAFCAPVLSAVPALAFRRQCGRLPLKAWDVAFTLAGRLFSSGVGLPTGVLGIGGPHRVGKEILRSVGRWRGFSLGLIRGKLAEEGRTIMLQP